MSTRGQGIEMTTMERLAADFSADCWSEENIEHCPHCGRSLRYDRDAHIWFCPDIFDCAWDGDIEQHRRDVLNRYARTVGPQK